MNYNSPFIKMLETIANMLIVSVLWLLFSLPVLTIIPSSAALFHTTSRIIFGLGRGKDVFKDFFDSYKENLVPGIKLNLIVIVAALFIAEGLWTGYQFYRVSIWGMLYMMLGVLITFVAVITLIHIPPVLSYFDAPVSSILRMAIYFAIRKPFRSILFVLLFVLMLWFIEAFPLALLIVPGLYGDLIRSPLNRDFKQFAADHELLNGNDEEETAEEPTDDQDSIIDIGAKFDQKKRDQ